MYVNMVRGFADNTIAATRLTNNMMFANMEAIKTSIETMQRNCLE